MSSVVDIPANAEGLAIHGGPAIRNRSFAPWPALPENVIGVATAVLRSGRLNYWTGDEGRRFEAEFASFVGCKHAIAVANGTVALELALYALGIGPGDEVIVPSRTFVASASCVIMRGAIPVFADIDRESQTITAHTICDALSIRTKAIIAVHLAGWPCDMDSILPFAREHGLYVIEDCAQSHGATYKGRPVGSLGDIAAFSFCQDKIMSTGGEGGMLTTNSDDWWRRAWSYKDHGKSYEKSHANVSDPGFRWLHDSFGTNWRMTEMQAAIGRELLATLPAQVEQRRSNAKLLNSLLQHVPASRITPPCAHIGHAYYKYYLFVRPECLRDGWTRTRVLQAICAEGVPCFTGSCSEVYLEKAFPPTMQPARRLPVARELGQTSLMFLVHPTLSEQDILDTARGVEKVLRVASYSKTKATNCESQSWPLHSAS